MTPPQSRSGVPVAVEQVGAGSKVAAPEVEERDILIGGPRLSSSIDHLELRGVVH